MSTKNYYIIDAHVHIYPEKIAEKASATIGEFYHIPMDYNGCVSTLIENGKRAGISRYLVHSVATTPQQVRKINEFLLKEIREHKEFIGFMTLHPDMTVEEISNEVQFGIENGFKGIKLHPDFQKFYVDGGRAENIYSVVQGRLPILFHAGDIRYGYSTPYRLANVAKRHKNLNIICAHFGGYSEWEKVGVYKGLDNVYFDTSSALEYISPDQAKSFIDEFGTEKFFFGTDYPMWDATEEIARFMKIPLTEKQREMIFSQNLINLLKLD